MATVTKLEAARRNLAAAIRLFFERGDAIAVHTLAAAAQGVVRDIARARRLQHTSILHDHPDIAPYLRKEWYSVLNAPRNFFKHADDDPNGTLEFAEEENVNVLLDAALVRSALDIEPLSEANVFIGWFTMEHPELRSAIANNIIGDYCLRNKISSKNFGRFRELCGKELLIESVQ